MHINPRWMKSAAIFCLILQVVVLAAEVLHFAAVGRHEHRQFGREQACSDVAHVHLASREEAQGEREADACRDRGTHGKRLPAAATSECQRWATSGSVVPCPSEHCLICSLSDLVRSSDIESTGEPLEDVFSVRCSADALLFRHLQGVFRPCLPRGPPVVS